MATTADIADEYLRSFALLALAPAPPLLSLLEGLSLKLEMGSQDPEGFRLEGKPQGG